MLFNDVSKPKSVHFFITFTAEASLFVRNGRPNDKLEAMNSTVSQSFKFIEDTKARYLEKVGKTLEHPATGVKISWSLLQSVLNKTRVPNIPPLLENDKFILDFAAKGRIFNDYCAKQCSTSDTCNLLSHHTLPIAPSLTDFFVSSEKTLSIIRSLNPDKAHGWNDVSVRMIKLCDAALVFSLTLIFENFLLLGVFPDRLKKANVVPVPKKKENNLKEHYRPFPLLHIFDKCLEKLIFATLYHYLESNSFLNSNQSVFRSGDSALNQLLPIVNSIFQAFECNLQ